SPGSATSSRPGPGRSSRAFAPRRRPRPPAWSSARCRRELLATDGGATLIQRAFGRLRVVANPLPTPPVPLELDACYRYCEALARARHHNFPVASLFLSSRLRRHIFAIYAFARAADDFADQPAFEERRIVELDRWE